MNSDTETDKLSNKTEFGLWKFKNLVFESLGIDNQRENNGLLKKLY